MIAFILPAVALAAVQPAVPHWGSLPPDTAAGLEAEGIHAGQYERLAGGDVLTERRPVPAGRTGVHMAVFGIVRSPINKLWKAIEDCGDTPAFMPHLESCALVKPDRPLASNQRWEELELRFRILLFNKSTRLVNEATLEAPHHMTWRQIRGDAKVNEGYYRVITVSPDTQIVVYDALVDPGIPVPGFVKSWILEKSLPGVITSSRDRVDSSKGRYAS
jgi:hypothetical protein